MQRSRKPEIPVLALEAFGEEEVRLKCNGSGLCNNESLERERFGKGKAAEGRRLRKAGRNRDVRTKEDRNQILCLNCS